MRRRGLIGGVLLCGLLLAGCGEKSKPVAAPPVPTVTSDASGDEAAGAATVIITTLPPPPERPDPPPNLPDEFLMIDRSGQIVSLDGKKLGELSGPYYYPNVNSFSDGGRSWTFKNGKVVRARPDVFQTRLTGVSRKCRKLGHVEPGTLFSCLTGEASLLLRTTSGNVLELVPPPPNSTGGHWRFAFPSPDGSRLLLYWSGECESPSAFFAPASGGTPTPADGSSDWRDAPESSALGWTKDGRALVLLGAGACAGGTRPPGVYAVDGYGNNTLVVKTRSFAAFFHR